MKAYNSKDITRVLGIVSERFAYADCEFSTGTFYDFRDKGDLTLWLEARFAEDDRFTVLSMDIATPFGTPPNDPRVAGVGIRRTSQSLQQVVGAEELGFKLILNEAGDRLETLALSGNVRCASFKPENR